MLRYVRAEGAVPDNAEATVAGVAGKGATPLLVSDGNRITWHGRAGRHPQSRASPSASSASAAWACEP